MSVIRLPEDPRHSSASPNREVWVKKLGSNLAESTPVCQAAGQSPRSADLASFLRSSLALIAEQLDAPVALAVLLGAGDLPLASCTLDRGGGGSRDADGPALASAKRAVHDSRLAEDVLVQSTGVPTLAAADEDCSRELRAYFRSRGLATMATVPIKVAGRPAGFFALGLGSSFALCPEQQVLLRSFAEQVSAALRLSGAGEGAWTGALGEEEQAARIRADYIRRWRGRVDRALGLLASSSGADAALGDVLREAVQQFGAIGGAIWRADVTGRGRLVLTFENGELREAEGSSHPGFHGIARAPHIWLHLQRGEVRIDDQETIRTNPAYAPFRDFLARENVRCLVVVPMYLADDLHGALTLRFAEDRRLTADDVELLETFANQAVFAAELTRLSCAARTAAVTEERNRLARDVHDTVAQGLAGIIRQLECADSEGLDEPARRYIRVAIELARDSLAETRRSIQGLHPDLCRGRRLDVAVEELVHRVRLVSAAEIQLTVHGRQATFPVGVECELLLILQEALTNTVKHSAATCVDVDLWMLDGAVRIRVRDDGVGFDPSCVVGGIGLSSMYERAQEIGATLSVSSVVGQGSEIMMSWSASRPSRASTSQY